MMDRGSAERAFGWHMQAANMAPHPDAAVGEWEHALDLAERFDLDFEVAKACAALCASEVERYGAPVTERYVRRGLAATSKQGIHVGVFLEYDALYEAARDSLGAAETRFTEALALIEGPDLARVLAGLGTVLLRAGRFEEARVRFAQGLDHADAVEIETRAAFETRVRLLNGLAEAERHAGDERAAEATCARVLEATKAHKRDPFARRYRARAHNALGLLRWRRGARAQAERAFTAALEVWSSDAERLRAGEAFVAWERRVALEYGAEPPVEGSPGDFCALAWVRLGSDLLVPAELTESPPSPASRAAIAAWRSGDTIEVPLRSLIGRQVGERWHVSRVQTLRRERRVLVELLAAGPVR